MAFQRLLSESTSERRAEASSPIKLSEKRDTLKRFAQRLRLNDSSLEELLTADVSMVRADGVRIEGRPAVLAALFQSQRARPHWDDARDWVVAERKWTRHGQIDGGAGVAQTFLLDEDGLFICAIVEERWHPPPPNTLLH